MEIRWFYNKKYHKFNQLNMLCHHTWMFCLFLPVIFLPYHQIPHSLLPTTLDTAPNPSYLYARDTNPTNNPGNAIHLPLPHEKTSVFVPLEERYCTSKYCIYSSCFVVVCWQWKLPMSFRITSLVFRQACIIWKWYFEDNYTQRIEFSWNVPFTTFRAIHN